MRVALASGETLALELPADLDRWQAINADSRPKQRVRGLTLLVGAASHALPVPVGFRQVAYSVEVGESEGGMPTSIRVSAAADDVTVSLTVYLKQMPPMVRVDLRRTGRVRWRPE